MAIDAGQPDGLGSVVALAVTTTLERFKDKPLPVRRRHVRPEGAAEYLDLDVGTLANWRSLGQGPKFRKIGARVVYDIEDLDAFYAQYPLHGSGTLELDGARGGAWPRKSGGVS